MGTALPQEGTTSNRYTILGRLAGGGMADIFLARASTEGGVERYVVLKRVLAERSRDPHFARMFLDEARLAAQLQHPNIAQVHDIGKLAGSYFFTMEYVHGEDVRHVLQRLSGLKKRLPINLALHIASGALAALHHAHTRLGADNKPLGVVHRDVSPSNVMVSFEGMVKLLDFGVAKAAQRSVESQSGSIKGKIAYLSPEQCKGGAIDRRSDLYSLGIVLHEMLTGRRLYRRDTDFAAMMAIATEATPAPSLQRPEISRELDAIVLRAMAKDPAERYASANDMLDAIEQLATNERHLVSSTAMGRYLRELFGEKPVPWIELQEREDDARQVTVTSESLADPLDAVGVLGDAAARPPTLDPDAQLVAQLDRAPALWSASADESEPDESLPPSPIEADAEPTELTVELPRATTPLHAPPPLVAPAPPPPSLGLATPIPTSSGVALPELAPRRRAGRWIVAVVIAIATVAIIVIATRGDSTPEPAAVRVAVTVDDAAVAVAPPTVQVDAAIAAVIPADAGTPPQPVRRPAPQTPPPPPPPPATIGQLATRGDWPAVARLCTHTATPSSEERASCGMAACNTKQRAAALGYYRDSSKVGRTAIERACRDHEISLVPQQPKKDPCEENPLQCQK